MEEKGGVLMQRYELGRLLGQGNFAKVYHGRSLITGISVAIKIVDKEKVLKLYEVMATKTKIYFIMEYVKGGELFNKVLKGKIKQDDARRYFQQLISAVDYCHSRGVCHRDLKPENLLLDENGNLKVSDFGLSAIAESRHQDGLLHTTCGTPAYVAPEVILRKGYDGFKADIWSCGVILYVLLADVKRLLSRILDPNPRTRISMAKIMESSWFKKGLEKPIVTNDNEEKELAPLDADGVFGSCENGGPAAESTPEFSKPSNLNAFDIISYSSGFDLSGLFEETDQKKQVRFTSNKPASIIISKLDEICKRLRLKLRKKDRGLIKLEGTNAGRKGPLGIDAEIFEITPVFHLVELKKSSGDTLEYKKLLQQEVRPALKDIVWNWQGEEPQGMLQIQQQNHSQSAQSDVITQSN
ncbi:hypothetical protein Ahy_B02g061502 isoform B [Arachis hypogaea]|uniref:non-specific serine/threonine protein kinase n=1 Tax=Arachis hypogaea TaxID=3818 RepID=A0A445AL40_ARAHY|nr:hypothetical protein Ahy_B02g061502 isoform B [Arachis hypogaea]